MASRLFPVVLAALFALTVVAHLEAQVPPRPRELPIPTADNPLTPQAAGALLGQNASLGRHTPAAYLPPSCGGSCA